MKQTLQWLFRATPKAVGSFDRSIPLADTMAGISALRRRFGITRVAETTHLDKLGLPTYCAVVPDSPDGISVYSGKGPTSDHALCSAVMEAVERQVGATCRPPISMKRPSSVRAGLDPEAMGMLPAAVHREMPFVRGINLLDGEPVWVPLAAVQCPWRGEKVFRWSSTHGLASGNTLLEAVYHALFELIERHVWAIVHTKAHVRPRVLLEALSGVAEAKFDVSKMVDDPVARQITHAMGHPVLDRLLLAIENAGLRVRLMALEEPDLPVVVSACLSEPGDTGGLGVAHGGYGASWSPLHAAIRAVAEAAQGRVVDIQGAREDVLRPTDPAGRFGSHLRRRLSLPVGRWYYDAPASPVRLDELPDELRDDLAFELRAVLDALRHAGVRNVIMVDLSPGDVPVHVVRLIAPELESATIDGRIGATISGILERL